MSASLILCAAPKPPRYLCVSACAPPSEDASATSICDKPSSSGQIVLPRSPNFVKEKPVASKSGPAGKYALKEIMQKSFKQEGNLKDLILEDMATAEQKTQFIDYVENLAQYKIRKGDADSWKEKTTALIAAAKGSDLAALEKATNCKACHSVHKIYPPTKK